MILFLLDSEFRIQNSRIKGTSESKVSEIRVKREESIESQAYRIIKGLILDKTLKPGERIVQEKVARMIGISRTPVKKAITQLIKEHLIVEQEGHLYVNSLSYKDLALIYEIRAVLEGLACRLAASKVRREWGEYMKNRFKEAVNDRKEYYEVDIEFHTTIPKLAEHPILMQVLDSFQILTRSFAPGLIRQPEETLPEHLAIIDALISQDEEKAEFLGREHIRASVYILREKATKESEVRAQQ